MSQYEHYHGHPVIGNLNNEVAIERFLELRRQGRSLDESFKAASTLNTPQGV